VVEITTQDDVVRVEVGLIDPSPELALSLEEHGAYTLIMVSVPLPGD